MAAGEERGECHEVGGVGEGGAVEGWGEGEGIEDEVGAGVAAGEDGGSEGD